jgi:uncharacterized protein YdaU (DUF1376 family)
MRAPAFQFYPKQWLGDDKVMGMDWDARAMHMHLMCIAWQQDPPCTIPDDDAMMRRWLANPENWPDLKAQILTAWKLTDGRWSQAGLLAEFNKQTAFRESRKNGAKSRWSCNAHADAHASTNSCINDALQSSSSSSTSDLNTKGADAPVDVPKPEPKPKPAPKEKTPQGDLPAWLSREVWDGFVIMRQRVRKPMTDRAKDLMLAKLARLHGEGQDVNFLVDRSTQNSWTDIWKIENDAAQGGTNGTDKRSPAKERVNGNRRAIAEALAKRGVSGPWDAFRANGAEVPEPRPVRNVGGVHGGSGETSPEILPPGR